MSKHEIVENDEKVGKRYYSGQLRWDWSLSGELSELVVRLRLGKDTESIRQRTDSARFSSKTKTRDL